MEANPCVFLPDLKLSSAFRQSIRDLSSASGGACREMKRWCSHAAAAFLQLFLSVRVCVHLCVCVYLGEVYSRGVNVCRPSGNSFLVQKHLDCQYARTAEVEKWEEAGSDG